MTEFIGRLSSRKFLITVAGVVGATLMYISGQLPADQWASTVKTLLTGYIAAEGLADIVSRIKDG